MLGLSQIFVPFFREGSFFHKFHAIFSIVFTSEILQFFFKEKDYSLERKRTNCMLGFSQKIFILVNFVPFSLYLFLGFLNYKSILGFNFHFVLNFFSGIT